MLSWVKRVLVGRPLRSDRLGETLLSKRLALPIFASDPLSSPYREITNPVLDHVNRLREEGPRDLVVVYIPEYVVGRWWEQLLHDQSALRLKARLLFQRRIMVVSVPWQLDSSHRRPRREPVPGRRRPEDREPVAAVRHEPWPRIG